MRKRGRKEGRSAVCSNLENVEGKVEVDGLATTEHMRGQTLVADNCEMGLTRDSTVVAFRCISLKEAVYNIYVLCVYDNIGLNLFT